MIRAFRQAWNNPRLRAEAGWVLFHKSAEFALVFLELKILTIIMGPKVFAEYRLVLSAALLLGHVTVMPMQQAYLRHRHTAETRGTAGASARFAFRWLTTVTLSVAVCAALAGAPLSRRLGLETWTILTGGLVFLGNRWRIFWIQLLEFKRLRRANTIQNLGFLLTEIVLVVAVLQVWAVSASRALLAYALAAALFGAVGARALARESNRGPAGADNDMAGVVARFGLPFGALLCCQWLLNFSERYILGIQLDLSSVGVYIAAYTVCGFPYMFGLAVLRGLLVPVAYQRCEGADDPEDLWSADVILLRGIAAYVVVGALTLPAYLLLGPWLLRSMTSVGFTLSAGTLFCLALARFVQCLGPLVETLFAVHKRMFTSLTYRLIGGVTVIPICWFSIKWYGVIGAAAGILIANTLYLAAVAAGPGGCLHLVMRTRRSALAARYREASDNASPS